MKILMIALRIMGVVASLALIAAAAVLLFLRFAPSVGRRPGRRERAELEEKSERYRGGQFHNETEPGAMSWKDAYPASDRRKPPVTLPAKRPVFSTELQPGQLRFTWLGHSSFLLQLGRTSILADPVFSQRCSPLRFIGPERFSRLPLTAAELPEIGVLFISHDHYDHLDYWTIRAIRDRVGAFVVPLGVDAVLRGWGVDGGKIHTLDWWESVRIGGMVFTLTPSQHFSGRDPLKRNCTLWGGVFISDGFHRVYYTGDGGYNGVFGEVRRRLGAPDLMIAECGQYDPAWASMHMFPEETVRAGLDAGAARLIPVHWGSFCICNHAWDDSIQRAASRGLPLVTPEIGRTVEYGELSACTEHWWEAHRQPDPTVAED